MNKIERLVPIEHDERRVLLTSQLAEMYGTSEKAINDNFSHNKSRYVVGGDYFFLKGEELKVFKNYTENFGVVDKRTPSLYLWTEHGALLHAKSLGTDEAWATYGKLVDHYSQTREAKPLPPKPNPDKPSKLSREKRDQAMLLNAKHRMVQDYRKLYEAAGIKPEYQIMALQDYIGEDGPRLPAKALGATKATYDKGTIAERLGVYSTSGLAHAQAIGAVISKLDVPPEEMERVPYARNAILAFASTFHRAEECGRLAAKGAG